LEAGEQGVEPDLAQLNLNTGDVADIDPARLLPELLEQLIALGQLARQISLALGKNGDRSERAAEIMRLLEGRG
jgi:hypothetical protein